MCKKVKLWDFQKRDLCDFYCAKSHDKGYWSRLKVHCESQIRDLSALSDKNMDIYRYLRYYNSLSKICDLKEAKGARNEIHHKKEGGRE